MLPVVEVERREERRVGGMRMGREFEVDDDMSRERALVLRLSEPLLPMLSLAEVGDVSWPTYCPSGIV